MDTARLVLAFHLAITLRRKYRLNNFRFAYSSRNQVLGDQLTAAVTSSKKYLAAPQPDLEKHSSHRRCVAQVQKARE